MFDWHTRNELKKILYKWRSRSQTSTSYLVVHPSASRVRFRFCGVTLSVEQPNYCRLALQKAGQGAPKGRGGWPISETRGNPGKN